LNSGLSLGEDIADIEGVRTALDAYHASLGGKPAPVIDGLTGDQRFFLSYASSHLEKLRPEAMQRQIGSDPHPPDESRVNITVSNVDEWYAAFDIHPDTPMYVPPEQRTRFW
jgi:predicted metalloendopeptidase